MNIDRFSMVTSFIFQCDEVDIFHTTLRIGIQAARPAPYGKCLGVDEGAHNSISIFLKLSLALLSFSQPSVEVFGHIAALCHDSEAGVVIFSVVLRHAN
ncbi:hypothetical protein [Nitrosomonas sp. Nm34]|uniref:hypothetical protein n=1 Tax=Nitrosomonas sp. Nm34 TaxID=1881055 RepID=UPI0008E71376|nr:hypothetical protein [Nitrosomonas sp. Nm34]SFJ02730.1 hypothetical protein SAMN05428978_10853 [Nitrosomonas sp. Nm34]